MAVAAAIAAYVALMNLSPWPPLVTVRHLLAFKSCRAAWEVGLTPSRAGEPGYWLRHDHEPDGLSYEDCGRSGGAPRGSIPSTAPTPVAGAANATTGTIPPALPLRAARRRAPRPPFRTPHRVQGTRGYAAGTCCDAGAAHPQLGR